MVEDFSRKVGYMKLRNQKSIFICYYWFRVWQCEADVDMQLVPKNLYSRKNILGTHLPTSEGWTAELVASLKFIILTVH